MWTLENFSPRRPGETVGWATAVWNGGQTDEYRCQVSINTKIQQTVDDELRRASTERDALLAIQQPDLSALAAAFQE